MAPRPETMGALLDELFLLGRTVKGGIAKAGGSHDVLPQPLVGVLWALELVGPSRQNQLAERLYVSESVLSRQLSALSADGNVERFRDPDDGRVSLVRITDKGRENLRAVLRHRFDYFVPKLGDWSDDEAREVIDSLGRLRRTVAD